MLHFIGKTWKISYHYLYLFLIILNLSFLPAISFPISLKKMSFSELCILTNRYNYLLLTYLDKLFNYF